MIACRYTNAIIMYLGLFCSYCYSLSTTQDISMGISVEPIELFQIISDESILQPQDTSFGGQSFATWRYSTSYSKSTLSVALLQPLQSDLKLLIKTQVPSGAKSNDWVEVSLTPQLIASEIPRGCAEALIIEAKLIEKGIAAPFNDILHSLQFKFSPQ